MSKVNKYYSKAYDGVTIEDRFNNWLPSLAGDTLSKAEKMTLGKFWASIVGEEIEKLSNILNNGGIDENDFKASLDMLTHYFKNTISVEIDKL